MKWKNMTMLIVAATLVILIVWDVFAIMDGGTESSISHLLIVWAYKYPIMPFAAGVVIGHLFWRMPGTKSLAKLINNRFDK